jgi:protein ImuA
VPTNLPPLVFISRSKSGGCRPARANYDGPVFLCRPVQAEHEPSAAPLRLQLRFGLDWQMQVQILKRKGPVHEGVLELAPVPGGLTPLITPRLAHPSELIAARHRREQPEASHAVGRPAATALQRRRAAH